MRLVEFVTEDGEVWVDESYADRCKGYTHTFTSVEMRALVDGNFDSDYKVDGKENRSIGMDEISLPFETKQTQQFIEDAVDHSEVSRKLDRLILLLCTNEESLKHSELCEGE